MPNTSRTHAENLLLVYICCCKKCPSMKKATGMVLKRIQTFFFEGFDPNDPKLPNGVCARCGNLLRTEQGLDCSPFLIH